jgi:hypothetical protein
MEYGALHITGLYITTYNRFASIQLEYYCSFPLL